MTLQFKRIEVKDRSVLMTLVINSWETICPDISLIDTVLVRGEDIVCDLVGIDQERRLVLVFIEMAEKKETLTNLINSFDWVRRNLKIMGRIYAQSSVNINALPVIIVIAPDFSREFIRALKYLEITEIGLYRFFCLEVDGERGVLLEEVKLPIEKGTIQEKEERGKPIPVCLECLGVTRKEEEEFLRV